MCIIPHIKPLKSRVNVTLESAGENKDNLASDFVTYCY